MLYNIYNFPIKEMRTHLQSQGPISGKIHKQMTAYKVGFSWTQPERKAEIYIWNYLDECSQPWLLSGISLGGFRPLMCRLHFAFAILITPYKVNQNLQWWNLGITIFKAPQEIRVRRQRWKPVPEKERLESVEPVENLAHMTRQDEKNPGYHTESYIHVRLCKPWF